MLYDATIRPISDGLAPKASAIMEINSSEENIAAFDSMFMLSAFIRGAMPDGYLITGIA